jgi:vancomycin permeability regulator SanA
MKWIIRIILTIFLILIVINSYIVIITHKKIVKINQIKDKDYDCIIVLGAGIKNRQPSPMLEDRLSTAIELYNKGVAPKIIVSGDHEYTDYDEVNVMKNYLKDNGIPSSDIFMDHAGISTYDSIYRARKIFKVNKAIIVTQKYHLNRALYIAKNINMKATGVSATKRRYLGQTKRNIREFAARIKDFFKCIFNDESTYLGEVIPINGNGDKTND